MAVDVTERGHPFLETMPAEVRALVAASLRPVSYAFGEAIVREGEEGDAMWLARWARLHAVAPTPTTGSRT